MTEALTPSQAIHAAASWISRHDRGTSIVPDYLGGGEWSLSVKDSLGKCVDVVVPSTSDPKVYVDAVRAAMRRTAQQGGPAVH